MIAMVTYTYFLVNDSIEAGFEAFEISILPVRGIHRGVLQLNAN